MITIDREKLAYAAGLYDGEGTSRFCLYNGKNRALFLRIKMTDVEPLRKFWEAINFRAKVYGPYREKKYKNYYRDNYQIAIQNFEDFQFVVCMLWNWLSQPKKDQFREALISYHNYRG